MRILARIERRTVATVCLCPTEGECVFHSTFYSMLPPCPPRLYQRRPLCPLQSLDPAAASFIHPCCPSVPPLCSPLVSLVFLVSSVLLNWHSVLLHLGRTLTNSAAIDISSGEWLIRPKQPLSACSGPMQTKTSKILAQDAHRGKERSESN